MSKLSPWLAHGCLSPRLLYEEVKRYERLGRAGVEGVSASDRRLFHVFSCVLEGLRPGESAGRTNPPIGSPMSDLESESPPSICVLGSSGGTLCASHPCMRAPPSSRLAACLEACDLKHCSLEMACLSCMFGWVSVLTACRII